MIMSFYFRVKSGSVHTGAKCTVPNELRGYTKCTGDTEQDRVELHLSQPVVSKEDTRVSINVRPWVLGFSSLNSTFQRQIRSE